MGIFQRLKEKLSSHSQNEEKTEEGPNANGGKIPNREEEIRRNLFVEQPKIRIIPNQLQPQMTIKKPRIVNRDYYDDKPEERLRLYPPIQRTIKNPKKVSSGKVIFKNPSDVSVSRYLEEEYEKKANEIAENICKNTESKEERLEMLFDYFLKNCKYWDSYPRIPGVVAVNAPYQYGTLKRREF